MTYDEVDDSKYDGPLKRITPVVIEPDTVSVVLAGGLGNMLFQIATLLSYAKDKNYSPLLGYWTTHQSETSRWSYRLHRWSRNHHFEPWGGHIMEDRPISPGDVYSQLPWFDSKPNSFKWWFSQETAYDYDTGKGGVYIDLDKLVKLPYLFQGYFFNQKYWHHNREYIVEKLKLDDDLRWWIDHNYGSLFSDETISLHMRLGNKTDFMRVDQVPYGWIIEKLRTLVINKKQRVLVFSDDIERAKAILYQSQMPRSQFYFIDEDPYICLDLMSKCDKHILSNSTLSFWGAYLDNVENNPHTYIHRSFLKEHCMEMIPYNNWKIEDWDENSEER